MTYSRREMERILKQNGYGLCRGRGKGSHSVFKNGDKIIVLSGSNNKMIFQRLIKENSLVV